MRGPRLQLISTVLLLGAVTGGCDRAHGPADPARVGHITEHCDAQISDAVAQWGAAGFSGAIVIDTPERSCRIAVGLADLDARLASTVDTVYAIGSVSKAFAAAAILQLEAQGALSLDDPAGRYVRGLHGAVATASIESLVLHTSGLVGSHGEDHAPLTRDQAVEAISGLEVAPARRGQFLYSNAGYTLLALVIEGASGIGYREYLRDRVLPDGAGFWDGRPAPSGPRAIGVRDVAPSEEVGEFRGPHWALQGNGDLAMSPVDLAAWTRDLFGGKLVPASSVARLLEPRVDAEGQGITFGWVRLDRTILGEMAFVTAGGGGDTGHNVVVAWLPASARTVVVASNTDGVTAEELLRTIGPAIARGEPLPLPDTRRAVDKATLHSLRGTYVMVGGDRFEVNATDGGLAVRPTGRGAIAAMLPPPGSSAAEVDEHERAVHALLAGRTSAGRDEVALLEREFGELVDTEVLGTAGEDGELRTYVQIEFRHREQTGWYALNDAGGIEAADLSGPPSVRLIPTTDGFRIDGGARGNEAVSVTFVDDRMTVRGADVLVATRESG